MATDYKGGDQPIVLIVEDQPDNINLLYMLLREEGYQLRVAEDGRMALQIVSTELPDLILLDVMMPHIDGFEVCRRLKKDVNTAEIPVIFISALAESENKLEGFSAGGVDYITKPFDRNEVLARVSTHIDLYRMRRQLEQRNRELEERNSELDAFAHTVAHDLKSPLNIVTNFSELLANSGDEFSQERRKEMLDSIRKRAYQATDIIEALLLLAGTSRHTDLAKGFFPMEDTLTRALTRISDKISETGAVIRYPKEWPAVNGYGPWVEEIWFNYLSNALKYGGMPPEIEVTCQAQGSEVICWVQDNGPGLDEAQQKSLFTPFTRLHTDRAEGHGLGLTIVERIANHLDGRAGVESAPGQGSRFFFALPAYQKPKAHKNIRLVDGELVFE